MRKTAMPVASGRRLGKSDIVVSMHAIVAHRLNEVLLQYRQQRIAGYTQTRMGVLSLGDMSIDILKANTKQWGAPKKFLLSGVVATDEIIDTVTQLVEAAAIVRQDGRLPSVLRAPKSQSYDDQLASLDGIATLFPLLVTCVEDTAMHRAWALTAEGTRRVEMVHGRIGPMPLFKLPLVQPKIADMSAYHLVLYLEEQCGRTCPPCRRTL